MKCKLNTYSIGYHIIKYQTNDDTDRIDNATCDLENATCDLEIKKRHSEVKI